MMALTTEDKEKLLNEVNSENVIFPEAKEGDIMYYPGGKKSIEDGDSLKLKYVSNNWEEVE